MNSQRTQGIVIFARDINLEGNLFGSGIGVFSLHLSIDVIQGSDSSGLL